MTDKQLLKAVSDFTKGILGGESSTDKCYMVCIPLCSYLYLCGIEAEPKEYYIKSEVGTHHHWVLQMGNKIIDPTADQFNIYTKKDMPQVYIGEAPAWYIPMTTKQHFEDIANGRD